MNKPRTAREGLFAGVLLGLRISRRKSEKRGVSLHRGGHPTEKRKGELEKASRRRKKKNATGDEVGPGKKSSEGRRMVRYGK